MVRLWPPTTRHSWLFEKLLTRVSVTLWVRPLATLNEIKKFGNDIEVPTSNVPRFRTSGVRCKEHLPMNLRL
jgi:hypothetical protein